LQTAVGKLKEVKATLDAKIQEASALETRNAELEGRVSELQEAQSSESASSASLAEKVSAAEVALSAAQSELAAKSEEAAASAAQLQEKHAALEALQAEAGAAAGRVGELEASLEAVQTQAGAKDEEGAQLRSQIADLEAQLETLRGSAEGEASERERSAQSLQALQDKASELEAQLGHAKSEADAKATEAADLTTTIERLQTEHSAALASQQEAAKGRLQTAVGKLKEVKATLDAKIQEASALETRNAELEGRVSELQAKNDEDVSLSSEMHSMKERVKLLDELEEAMAKKVEELNESNSKYAELLGKHEELLHTKEQMKGTAGKAMEKLKELKAEVDRKNTALAATQEKLSALEAEHKSSRMQNLESTQRMQSDLDSKLVSQREALQAEIAALKEKLSGAEGQLSAVQGEAVSASTSIADAATKIEDLHSRLAEALQAVEDRDAQLVSYADHVGALEQKLLDSSTASSSNEQELVKLRRLLDRSKARVSLLQNAAEANKAAPVQFDLIARVSVNEKNWCLVRREKFSEEIEATRLLDRLSGRAKPKDSAKQDNPPSVPAEQAGSPPRKHSPEKMRTVEDGAPIDGAAAPGQSAEAGAGPATEAESAEHISQSDGALAQQPQVSEVGCESEHVAACHAEAGESIPRPSGDTESAAAAVAEAEAAPVAVEAAPSSTEPAPEPAMNSEEEAEAFSMEWRPESEVLQWMEDEKRKAGLDNGVSGADAGFSIADEDDYALPPTLQDALRDAFDVEKATLHSQIEALAAEKEQSQLAFDRYRERARVSLLKTAQEQKDFEETIESLRDEAKLEALKASKVESTLRGERFAHETQLQALQGDLRAEREQVEALTDQIAVIQETVRRMEEEEQSRLSKMQEESSRLASDGERHSKELEAELDTARRDCEALRVREKQLIADMKKRGDTARHMLLQKDKEIMTLLEKEKSLKAAASTPTTTPTSAPAPAGAGVGAGAGPQSHGHAEAASSAVERSPDQSQGKDIATPSMKTPTKTGNVVVGDVGSPSSTGMPQMGTPFRTIALDGGGAMDGSAEQHVRYLRQAFVGFFRAKHGVEMQHLGRVICAILGVEGRERAGVMESIDKLAPTIEASSTLDTFTEGIISFFN
jgi:DNA repair exonuclease SbcCD ATPase subunit